MLFKVLLIVCIFERGYTTCPHERSLKKWSEYSTWGAQGKPTKDQSVEISEEILLDESPPDLYNITILKTGSLVFDPTTELKLRVANIYVYGSFEIGSEECTYDGQLTVTLTGNRESHAGEKESKVILVNDGGTIEIHGPPKLSWTKLDTTLIANHENENMLFEHKRNETFMKIREVNNGVSAYTVIIEDNKPVIKQFGMYDIVTHGLELVEQIKAVQEGEVLMMASRRRIRNPGDTRVAPKVYGAFETLLYGEVTDDSILRYVDNIGATWAFVYQKGNPKSYAESTHPKGTDSYARFRTDSGLIFSAEAYGHFNPNQQTDNYRIGNIDDIFPKLELVDDATTWLPGDRIAIASTDYRWEQAEEAEIILCTDCAPNQVRIDAVVKYRHFGEIVSESVDMRAEVAMLSRTVVIEGEMETGCPTYNGNCGSPKIKNIDTFGAHIKILHGYNNSRIENIELRNVGQQTDLGRYPVHWHMTFDKKESAAVPYARGLSIHNTFARCVTIHGTNGVRVENNVCYNHMGHGYFLEDGGEIDNLFDGNLAMTARRGTGDLEPSDTRPTGFWITNPRNYISNNVAAGGEGTGIWMIFPNQPLGPSSEYNLTTFEEARRTNCPLFYNNVAHSNNMMGIHVGHTLKDDRTFACCNKWQPLEDPNDLTSNPVPIILDKITGYKNKVFNAWLEGGLLEITRLSVADSANSVIVSNDGLNSYAGKCSQSVVIGESINTGVPDPGSSANRSLPNPREPDQVQSGITTWMGPAHFSEMWFDGFQTNPNYDIVAIAKKRGSPYFHPVMTSFEDVLFAFDDGEGLGRYTMSGTPADHGWESSSDGELMSGFTLYQDIPGRPADHFYVVRPDPFTAAPEDCILRPNWQLAICETKYGNLRIAQKTKKNPIIFVRDDLPSAQLEYEMEFNAGPEVVIDGSQTYTVHFPEKIDTWVKFFTPGLDKGDTLRIGVCLPLDAEWDIKAVHPHYVSRKSRFTEVDSLAELDKEDTHLDGKKYYFDYTTGMVYFKFVNTVERPASETSACYGKCSEVQVKVSSGNFYDADCRSRLYNATQLSMSLPTLPVFDDVLSANGGPTPPSSYGARSTRPFLERPDVDGGFGDWSDWSACSRTCAGGEQYRTRPCNNPMPQNGGASCDGDTVETRVCNDDDC